MTWVITMLIRHCQLLSGDNLLHVLHLTGVKYHIYQWINGLPYIVILV